MKSNRQLYSSIALVISIFSPVWLCEVSADDEAHKILARAERFAWLQNWDKARPLYQAAEKQFIVAGDPRKAALSRIGLILSRIYTTDSLELLALLEQERKNPVVSQDPNLKLRCLAAKAYLEEQPDLLVSRESWTQVLELARHLGNKGWEARASGHLGIFSWVIDIDSVGATRRVGEALVDVIGSNDLSAQVWLQKDIGNVLCLMRRFEAAMNFFQKALTSSNLDKDSPFPFDVYVGKARGLIQMGKVKEGLVLVDRVLQEASQIGEHNAIAEALILRARGLSTGSSGEAVSWLNRAISLARENHFQRTLSDALEEMASLHQAAGEFEKAEEYQAQCIEVTRGRHDGYSLPQRFSRLAEIYVKRGRISDANALYDQATDIIEALLINSPSPYAKASLIDWLSDIFTSHFKLAVNQLNDPEQALTILERARGRTLAEALRNHLIEPSKGNFNALVPSKKLSFLNSKLLEAKTAAERKDLLDQLFIAEQRMAPAIAQRNSYFRHVISRPASLQ
ncbi:MAG: tetratricopeptide repeat protein, partial [Terriglobia bacterium]